MFGSMKLGSSVTSGPKHINSVTKLKFLANQKLLNNLEFRILTYQVLWIQARFENLSDGGWCLSHLVGQECELVESAFVG